MRKNTARRLREAVALRTGCLPSKGNDDDDWGSDCGYSETSCAYCGTLITVHWPYGKEPYFLALGYDDYDLTHEVAHMDHVISECANGPTSLDNTVLACAPCNVAKGAMALGDQKFLTWMSNRRQWLLDARDAHVARMDDFIAATKQDGADA